MLDKLKNYANGNYGNKVSQTFILKWHHNKTMLGPSLTDGNGVLLQVFVLK